MDPSFKPYRTGMMTVLERYPCGKENGKTKGRCFVYYLCKCDCGKEFIVGGDELSKHPYSCGCTPKPKRPESGRLNNWALGYDEENHTMTCMLKHTRAVYSTCKSGVSGVVWNKKRKHWEAHITFQQVEHYLGSFKTKKEAIQARIEGEKKYFDSYINKMKNKKENTFKTDKYT